jgi:hypothetical protein
LSNGQTPDLPKLGIYKGKDKDIMEFNFFEFIILALACFRLTRLIVFDKITEFIRVPFFDEIIEEHENGITEIYYMPKSTPVKKFIGTLLSCYWCTGIWVAAGVLAGYYLLPTIFHPIILVFAIAGLAAIMESLIQLWMDK